MYHERIQSTYARACQYFIASTQPVYGNLIARLYPLPIHQDGAKRWNVLWN